MAYKRNAHLARMMRWLGGIANNEESDFRYALAYRLRLCKADERLGTTKVIIPIDLFQDIVKVLEE